MTHGSANAGGLSAQSLSLPKAYLDPQTGKLFVADRSNNRVLIYNSLPTSNYTAADVVIGQPDMVSNVRNNGGISAHSMYYPYSVNTDGQRLLISDYFNSRVLLYNEIPTTNGVSADVVLGQNSAVALYPGSTANKLDLPPIAQFVGNRIMVMDYGNSRVLFYPTGPQHGTFASPGAFTASSDINLSLGADDAKDVLVSENADLSGATWQPFDASYAFTLSSGDGPKTVYVKYRDYANYEGSALSAATTLDTGAPTGAININSGALLTNSKDTTLTLSATDTLTSVTHMKLSESATFVGASWEAYATSKAFTLSSGDVLKTVYAKYKDSADNESDTYSSTITLDTTRPTIKITDIGLIDNVPDKTPLYYYFTSQTPHFKGTICIKSNATKRIHAVSSY